MNTEAHAKLDVVAIAITATAPAWVEPLSSFNTILATISLVLGITLACARIYLYFKNK